MSMKNILILCTGNSCRSQMAEGYLRHFAGTAAKVKSAGIEVHGVNPIAVKVMAEDNIDISHHTSNHVDEYKDIPFDYIITVCGNADEKCPVIFSNAKKIHHGFPDPAKATGTEEEKLMEFRKVRNEIKAYFLSFYLENLV
jgi:arsenate reductase